MKWNHRSGEDEGATILDMGAGGIFLNPFGTAPSNLQNGNTVWISLRPKGHDDDVVLAASIRWRGFSKLHGEIGFGIEFDEKLQRKGCAAHVANE
ncbi:MAG: PilZ domain-containing protein [Deltaproteobacteria bacterium]|nr:PilZ domain-containing protein [Deltaproteobacteria bacterium]